jgi:hypothetical protein
MQPATMRQEAATAATTTKNEVNACRKGTGAALVRPTIGFRDAITTQSEAAHTSRAPDPVPRRAVADRPSRRFRTAIHRAASGRPRARRRQGASSLAGCLTSSSSHAEIPARVEALMRSRMRSSVSINARLRVTGPLWCF